MTNQSQPREFSTVNDLDTLSAWIESNVQEQALLKVYLTEILELLKECTGKTFREQLAVSEGNVNDSTSEYDGKKVIVIRITLLDDAATAIPNAMRKFGFIMAADEKTIASVLVFTAEESSSLEMYQSNRAPTQFH